MPCRRSATACFGRLEGEVARGRRPARPPLRRRGRSVLRMVVSHASEGLPEDGPGTTCGHAPRALADGASAADRRRGEVSVGHLLEEPVDEAAGPAPRRPPPARAVSSRRTLSVAARGPAGSRDRRCRASPPASRGSAPGGTGPPGCDRARTPGPRGASARGCGRPPVPPIGRGATGTMDRSRPGRARRSRRAYQPSSTSGGRHDRAAERRRQGLATEADPEHRYAGGVRLAEEGELRDGPGADQVVVVDRPGRAHRHDHVVPASGSGKLTVTPGWWKLCSGTTTSSSMS